MQNKTKKEYAKLIIDWRCLNHLEILYMNLSVEQTSFQISKEGLHVLSKHLVRFLILCLYKYALFDSTSVLELRLM